MAAKFESIASAQSTGSPLVIGKPSGLAVGNLMVAFMEANHGIPSTLGAPAGWAKHDQTTPPIGNPQCAFFSKVADSADVAASNFSFTDPANTGAEPIVGSIYRLPGGVAVDTFVVGSVNNVPSPPSLASPPITTGVDKTLLLGVCLYDSTGADPTILEPILGFGFVEKAQEFHTTAGAHAFASFCLHRNHLSLAGAGPLGIWNHDGGGNVRAVLYLVSIIPDAVIEPILVGVSGKGSTANQSSIVIPKPAGITVGKLLVGSNACGRADTTPDLPSGWTNISGPTLQGSVNHRLFEKIADAGDVAAANFTFTLTGTATGMGGGILVFEDHGGGVNAFTSRAAAPSTSPTRFADGATSIGADVFAAVLFAMQDSTSPLGVSTSGWGKIFDEQGIGGVNVAYGLFTRDQLFASPGTVEDFDGTFSGGVAVRNMIGYMIVVGPPPVPPGAGPIGGFRGPFRLLARRWRILGTGA